LKLNKQKGIFKNQSFSRCPDVLKDFHKKSVVKYLQRFFYSKLPAITAGFNPPAESTDQ